MFSRVNHREVDQKSRSSQEPLKLVTHHGNSANSALLPEQEFAIDCQCDIISDELIPIGIEYDRLQIIRKACDVFSENLNPDEIAQKTLGICRKVIPFEYGNIFLNRNGNWRAVNDGTDENFKAVFRALEDRGSIESMFCEYSYDVTSHRELGLDEPMMNSGTILSFPMIADSKRIGVCLIYTAIEESDFSTSDMETIKIVVNHAALAIQYRQTREELAEKEVFISDLQSWLIRSSRMAIVGEIAKGLTHEINNPLQIILGKIQMASMGMGSQEVLKQIESQALHVASLIRSLSEISKEGKSDSTDVIELNSFIKNSVEVIKKQVEKKGIKILYCFQNEGNTIHADSRHLRLLILNSVLEAKKRMPAGGELSIKTSLKENDVIQIEFLYSASNPESVLNIDIAGKDMGVTNYEEIVSRLLAAEMGAIIDYKDDEIAPGYRIVLGMA